MIFCPQLLIVSRIVKEMTDLFDEIERLQGRQADVIARLAFAK
jgi:hypothetical protein